MRGGRRIIIGPGEIDCPGKCEVPKGAVVEEVAPTAYVPDGRPMEQCPNIGCGKILLFGGKPK